MTVGNCKIRNALSVMGGEVPEMIPCIWNRYRLHELQITVWTPYSAYASFFNSRKKDRTRSVLELYIRKVSRIFLKLFGFWPLLRIPIGQWLSSLGLHEIGFWDRVQNGFGAHPSSFLMCSRGSFPGVKRTGLEADPSPPFSAEVKECVELYLYSPNTLSWRGAQFSVADIQV
jgi:hypothetical protein